MPEGRVHIAQAYVTVETDADQSSAEATAKKIEETLKAGVGDVNAKVTASVNAAQVRVDAQRAADAARAKIVYDDAIDKAKLLSDADRAAAEAKAQIKYESDIDAADLKAKATLAAEQAKAEIKLTANPDLTSAATAGEEMGKVAGEAAKEAESGSGGGSWLPILISSGITAGIPLIGAAASLAGVAAVGALGTAVIAKTPEVTDAFHNLVTTSSAELYNGAQVMITPIQSALESLTGFVSAKQPILDDMFKQVSADVPILTNGIEGLVSNALPGLDNMLQHSQPIANGIATVMKDIGAGVDSIENAVAGSSGTIQFDLEQIGTAAKNVATAVGDLVTIGSKVGTVVGPALSGLSTLLGQVTGEISGRTSIVTAYDDGLKKINGDLNPGKFLDVKNAIAAQAQAADAATTSISLLTNGLQLETAASTFSGPAENIAEGLAKIGDKAADDKQKMQGLNEVIEAIVNPGGAAISTLAGISTTEQGLADSLKGLTGPLVDQAGNLDLNSKRGAAAATAIEGLAGNYTQYITQAEQAKVPTDQINSNLQVQYDNLVKTAEQLGVNKDHVAQYLAGLGILPPSEETQITTPGMQQALADILSLHGEIDGVPTDHTIHATALTADAIQQLKDLGYTVTTLPDGSVDITANTAGATGTVNQLIDNIDGRIATIQIHGVVTGITGGGSVTNLLHATGGITPRLNAGGNFTAVPQVAGFAAPGLPVSPDGGRNVLGDRRDVAEAFIPLDDSARSNVVLDETAAAMGRRVDGRGGDVHNHYSPSIVINGGSPGQAIAEMQSEFAWWTMTMGRAA